MSCVHTALDALGADTKLAETARGSVADALNAKADKCLRNKRDLEPLQEFKELTTRMCACTNDTCRKAVAKEVVRATLIENRFVGVRHTEAFRVETEKLDACYGEPIFE